MPLKEATGHSCIKQVRGRVEGSKGGQLSTSGLQPRLYQPKQSVSLLEGFARKSIPREQREGHRSPEKENEMEDPSSQLAQRSTSSPPCSARGSRRAQPLANCKAWKHSMFPLGFFLLRKGKGWHDPGTYLSTATPPKQDTRTFPLVQRLRLLAPNMGPGFHPWLGD